MAYGWVAPGYEGVRDEFERNFRSREELGAAFAAYVGGEKVVDLWGGWADPPRTRPWREDTRALVFSATKGVGAMVLAHLNSQGLLDYDRSVASYWPEFAQSGKADVTVRQLVSHQAGIVFPAGPIDQLDPARTDAAIAAAAAIWAPGDYQGYHAATIGFAMSALVRRTDPAGRGVDRYLREEILAKVDAEFMIGLPEGSDMSGVAVMKPFSPFEAMLHLGQIPAGLKKVLFDTKSLFWRSMGDGGADPNSRAFFKGENPSGNGVCTARGLAALYGELASGGRRIGLSPETLAVIFGEPEHPRLGYVDRVMNMEARYGLGFQKSVPGSGWFSPNPGAIGFMGASGAFGFADDRLSLGAAYITNRMSPGTQINDPRERALREALYRAASNLA